MEREEIERIVSSALETSGMGEMAAESRARLIAFLGEVALWSGRIHLIGKERLAENMRNQLADSLLMLGAVEREAPHALAGEAPRLADIGSGAGFPGLVWKIARPKIAAVLFERRLKPHAFLERAIATLGLSGAESVGGDAASFPSPASFDLVLSKAAGRLGGMLPLAERLLAPGGIYATVKGASWKLELDRARVSGMAPCAEIELPEGRGLVILFERTC